MHYVGGSLGISNQPLIGNNTRLYYRQAIGGGRVFFYLPGNLKKSIIFFLYLVFVIFTQKGANIDPRNKVHYDFSVIAKKSIMHREELGCVCCH